MRVHDSSATIDHCPSVGEQAGQASKRLPKINFHGITLKQYFQLCTEQERNREMDQIEEQSQSSCKSSLAQTPNFAQSFQRPKMRTEINQEEAENIFRNNNIRNVYANPQDASFSQGKAHHLGQHSHHFDPKHNAFRRKIELKKPYHPKLPYSNSRALQNRSTMNSFYAVEERKAKMLSKIKIDKDRSEQLRLRDLFLITKYGSRFTGLGPPAGSKPLIK